MALLDALLTQPVTEHVGEFYQAHDARMIPGTIAAPRPPFVVAANGPRALALAARYGQGWVTYGPSFDTDGDDIADRRAAQEQWWTGLEGLVAQFDAAEAAAGRTGADRARRYLSLDGAPMFSLLSVDLAVEGVERAAALGFTDVVVHWPRAEGSTPGPCPRSSSSPSGSRVCRRCRSRVAEAAAR
ncbi:LLM class flavin-dependent oxidoreductase [Cellulomonas soli]